MITQEMIDEELKELHRLQEMVNEQHRLIHRMQHKQHWEKVQAQTRKELEEFE